VGILLSLVATGRALTAARVGAAGLLAYATVFFFWLPIALGVPLAAGCLLSAKRLVFPPPDAVTVAASSRRADGGHCGLARLCFALIRVSPLVRVLRYVAVPVFIVCIMSALARDAHAAVNPSDGTPSTGLHVPVLILSVPAGLLSLAIYALKAVFGGGLEELMDGGLQVLVINRLVSTLAQYVFTGFAFRGDRVWWMAFAGFQPGWIASAMGMLSYIAWRIL
jgi:hypothetical protein